MGRAALLEERVYARSPQHMSQTNEAQPQRVCSRSISWPPEGTTVGPSEDTHRALAHRKRRCCGWPTPTPKGRSTVSMTNAADSTKHKSSDKHGCRASYHDLPAGGEDCRGTEGEGRLQGREGEIQEADEDSDKMIEETDVPLARPSR